MATKAYNILIVNPNSTEGFTKAMKAHVESLFPPGSSSSVKFHLVTAPHPSPASITSVTTSNLSATHSLPAILPLLDSHSINAIVIACFSAHPLVSMLRELTTIPTVGIMEAGILFGSQLGGKVGIVTTDKRWEPLLEHEIKGDLGLSHQCSAGVLSTGLTVLELEHLPKEQVHHALASTAVKMVQTREADVILLGCAGMVGLDKIVQAAVGEEVTVLDPVVCAVEMAMSLARMGVRTAKKGRYEMSSM